MPLFSGGGCDGRWLRSPRRQWLVELSSLIGQVPPLWRSALPGRGSGPWPHKEGLRRPAPGFLDVPPELQEILMKSSRAGQQSYFVEFPVVMSLCALCTYSKPTRRNLLILQSPGCPAAESWLLVNLNPNPAYSRMEPTWRGCCSSSSFLTPKSDGLSGRTTLKSHRDVHQYHRASPTEK